MRTSSESPFSISHGAAIFGAVAWLVLLAVELPTEPLTGFVQRLLMVAPLVVVPLALTQLTPPPDASPRQHQLFRILVLGQPVGAAFAVGSLYAPTGVSAALLTLPWLLVTSLMALFGLLRIRQRGRFWPLEELAIDAALLYIPVGGGWWALSRYGAEPMDFPPIIVLLTAVHFHYAGMAAPLITGLAGRLIPDTFKRSRAVYVCAAVAAIVATPMIAIGITISPLLEVICAVILALGLLLLSGVMFTTVGPRLGSKVAWALCYVASASLLVTMAFACMYAVGEFRQAGMVPIPRMAEVHGVVNVFGFSLCGLLAMVLASPQPRDDVQAQG